MEEVRLIALRRSAEEAAMLLTQISRLCDLIADRVSEQPSLNDAIGGVARLAEFGHEALNNAIIRAMRHPC